MAGRVVRKRFLLYFSLVLKAREVVFSSWQIPRVPEKNTKDTNIETLLLVACNVCKREKETARKNEGVDEIIEFL